jgi:hypothetical protein
VDSSLAFSGNYTSGEPLVDSLYVMYGYPADLYPNIIDSARTGGGVNGWNKFPRNQRVPVNTMSTRDDYWYLNVRYSLTVPLIKKLTWLANIDISNPFNHRGIAGRRTENGEVNYWFNISGAPGLGDIVYPGSPAANAGSPILAPYSWARTGEITGLYRERQQGRRFSVETGLRF